MHDNPVPASDTSSRSTLSALTETRGSDLLDSRKKRRISLQRFVTSALFLIAIAFLLPSTGRTQVDQGAITGTVTDSTGAVMAGANVTLTATETGLPLKRNPIRVETTRFLQSRLAIIP